MTRSFATKIVGIGAVLLLGAALVPSLAVAGTDVGVEQTIRVPGGIGAFYVGPLTATVNGQKQTLVPRAGTDGVKNLAITFDAARGGEIDADLAVGKNGDCSATALLNTLAGLSVGGSSAAVADIFVEFDRQAPSGTLTHKWLNSEGEEVGEKTSFFNFASNSGKNSGGISMPICVNSPLE